VIVRYTQLWKLVQSVRLRESRRPAYMVNGRHDLRAHVADADLRQVFGRGHGSSFSSRLILSATLPT